MNTITYEVPVINGTITLPADMILPEIGIVRIIVPTPTPKTNSIAPNGVESHTNGAKSAPDVPFDPETDPVFMLRGTITNPIPDLWENHDHYLGLAYYDNHEDE